MDKLTEQWYRTKIEEAKGRLEEKQLLQEMAAIGKPCKGFRMIVKTNDSATKEEPAHVTIQETNSHKIIGKVFLDTEKPPKSEKEIKVEVKESETWKRIFDKEQFLEWANAPYRNSNLTNWEQAINSYKDQQEEYHPGQI